MRCEDLRNEISALADGELAPERREAIAGHIASCAGCAAIADDHRRISATLRAYARQATPADLDARIRLRLEREDAGRGEAQFRRSRWAGLARQAAALAVVAGLSGALGWKIGGDRREAAQLERDVLVSHARSLMQDATTQIASTDRHTVKPWFTGRIDFAPAVHDLATQGFPLKGGRLELIGGRRVAAIVYTRRQHVINVYMWPSDGAPSEAAPRLATSQGFNILAWSSGGLSYWAISDLNAAELRQLQALL